jgi:hypothetical protein
MLKLEHALKIQACLILRSGYTSISIY